MKYIINNFRNWKGFNDILDVYRYCEKILVLRNYEIPRKCLNTGKK